MSEFTMLFEISKATDCPFIPPILAGVVVLIAGIAGLIIRKVSHSRVPLNRSASLLLTIFGIVWLSFFSVFLRSYNNKTKTLISAYENGQYKVLEGVVYVKHEQPKAGHAKGDIISINGKELEIDYFVTTPAYHQTIAHGGTLKDGIYARVYYYGGRILRVDVRNVEDPDPREPSSKLVYLDDTISQRVSMRITWKDYIWIVSIIISNVLFYIRKIILARYGYGISLFDLQFEDWKRLRDIAKKEVSKTKKIVFLCVNRGVILLVTFGLLVFILTRVV